MPPDDGEALIFTRTSGITPPMLDYQQAKIVAKIAGAIGEATRLAIVELLSKEPKYVGDLAKEIGVPMVNMSHHLSVMKQAGLVSDLRQGRKKLYSLSTEVFEQEKEDSNIIKMGLWRMYLTRIVEG